MARYAAPCGWISRVNTSLSDNIGNLEAYVLGKHRLTDLPEGVIKNIKEAEQLMNRAQAKLYEASRALIEEDVDESMKEKEVDHEG